MSLNEVPLLPRLDTRVTVLWASAGAGAMTRSPASVSRTVAAANQSRGSHHYCPRPSANPLLDRRAAHVITSLPPLDCRFPQPSL